MTTDPSYPKRELMIARMIFYAQIAGIPFFLVINKPSPEKIGRDINLTQSEIDLF